MGSQNFINVQATIDGEVQSNHRGKLQFTITLFLADCRGLSVKLFHETKILPLKVLALTLDMKAQDKLIKNNFKATNNLL